MVWMELEFGCLGETVTVAARGSRGERTRTYELDAEFSARRLGRFRVGLGNAIARSNGLDDKLTVQARALHEAILCHEIRDLYIRLTAAASDAKSRLLLRIMINDPRLQAIPWEAVCRPNTSSGFLGTSSDVHVARGVNSTDPWQPRELRRSLKILPISAIEDRSALAGLELVLAEHVASGAIEILDPIEGEAARNPALFERLRAGPSPHVLHFLGHGGFDRAKNPVIRLADDEFGEKTLMPMEVFAEELRASFDSLRLIFLQACSGARPGVFASAAELLARAGADAVAAFLWPVKAEVARAAARDFYSNLVGARSGRGDVVGSMQSARRTLASESAECFSPVLYLRGTDSQLFDLESRRLRPPRGHKRSASTSSGELPRELAALLRERFSFVLGGAWDDEAMAEVQDKLSVSLVKALRKHGEQPPETLPLYSLAQRFALSSGTLKLGRLFQKVLSGVQATNEVPAMVDAIAPFLRPGVHTTLLWLPVLEHALVKHHASRTIYVIQPAPPNSDERRLIMARAPGDDEWEELDELPRLRLEESFVVLRLYGGYSPEEMPILTSPQVTEDDHIQGLFNLRYIIPPAWENLIMGSLRTRPALCLGVSAMDWRHRMLLRWLFDQRPPPNGSLAILSATQQEHEIWEKRGAGLPGGSRFAVVQEATDTLVEALRGVVP